MAESQVQDGSQSLYNQEEKKKCRKRLIEHAVRCLTTERDESVCIQRYHVDNIWKKLRETDEAKQYFSREERRDIETGIEKWTSFHESLIQTRRPSDLRVCYLAGDNPINDLEVFIANGVLAENVWAIEKDTSTVNKAHETISCHPNFETVKIFKGNILNFLIDFKGQFDIIYYDSCGTLPSPSGQNTLKFIGTVFLHDKLTSPGALITNFSFPPGGENFSPEGPEAEERDRIRFFSGEYLKYRLLDEECENSVSTVDEIADYLNTLAVEDIYSKYITYQVIDSALLFIPAYTMLSATRSGKSCPLWDQLYASKDNFLKEVKEYDRYASNIHMQSETTSSEISNSRKTSAASKSAAVSESNIPVASKTPAPNSYSNGASLESPGTSNSRSCVTRKSKKATKSLEASKSTEELIQELLNKIMKHMCKVTAYESNLRRIASAMKSQVTNNSLCEAWVNEIFPDWKSSRLLKDQEISSLLLTYLLSCSREFILRFANKDFKEKCLKPLFMKFDPDKQGGGFCDEPDAAKETCLHGSLLYGQMAYPSLPVEDKVLDSDKQGGKFCDELDAAKATCLLGNLLYGQMAYPSLPVEDKLLDIRYTARKRQMFSNVFIFDKCRYLFEQLPSVHFAHFALTKRKHQMLLKMITDGLRTFTYLPIAYKRIWGGIVEIISEGIPESLDSSC